MTMSSPAYEVADVIRKFGQSYRQNHALSLQQSNAMFAIEHCRTEVLGGHIDTCSCCGHQRIFYNSCRNRHCPKCGGMKREQWVDKLAATLLPVKYFHIVLTIPAELNTLAFYNPKCLYDIFFQSASAAIMTLAKEPKFLGAVTGMVAVLHTWGQNLQQHPHIHTMVPAGGWHQQRGWIHSGDKFFLPAKKIASCFRKTFLSLFKDAYRQGQLKFYGEAKLLEQKKYFEGLLTGLYQKQWNIKTLRPFKNSAHIIKYLGRYTHRVAISNHRIKDIEDQGVTFSWKDYKDGSKRKLMTLKGEEFIHRFLLHVLPKGYCKIRYYGIFALCHRGKLLEQCRTFFKKHHAVSKYSGLTWRQALALACGINVEQCPLCKEGVMATTCTFGSKRAPPLINMNTEQRSLIHLNAA